MSGRAWQLIKREEEGGKKISLSHNVGAISHLYCFLDIINPGALFVGIYVYRVLFLSGKVADLFRVSLKKNSLIFLHQNGAWRLVCLNQTKVFFNRFQPDELLKPVFFFSRSTFSSSPFVCSLVEDHLPRHCGQDPLRCPPRPGLPTAVGQIHAGHQRDRTSESKQQHQLLLP